VSPATDTSKQYVYNTYFYYSTIAKNNIPISLKEQSSVRNVSQASSLLELYPNPAQNEARFRIVKGTNQTGMLYNAQGQLMSTFKVIEGENTINIEKLQKGFYIMKIPTAQGILMGKFMKE
jgi:hypothetical protein